jgi:hypothetical protein
VLHGLPVQPRGAAGRARGGLLAGVRAARGGGHRVELLLGAAQPEHLKPGLHAARGSSRIGGAARKFLIRWTEIKYGDRGDACAYLVLGDAGVAEALVVGLVAALSHGGGSGVVLHRACEVFFSFGLEGGLLCGDSALKLNANANK